MTDNDKAISRENIEEMYERVISCGETYSCAIDTDCKQTLFCLGVAFASGKRLHITNEDFVKEQIKRENGLGKLKTYYMSSLFWADNGLCADIKPTSCKKDRSFLICPVANATQAQKAEIGQLLDGLAEQKKQVYYPARDTEQSPYRDGIYHGGYYINEDNAKALSRCGTVYVYYVPTSKGSIFDLGIVYHYQKTGNTEVVVLNNVDKQSADFGTVLIEALTKGSE